MGVPEIIIIAFCASVVIGVIISSVIKKKNGKCSCDCDGNCSCCRNCGEKKSR